MLPWKILNSGRLSGEKIMQIDHDLLKNLSPSSEPILHFYEWASDSATYGYFTKPEEFLNLEKAQELSLQLAKRTTGGGIVFHLSDLAFSLLLPSSHPKFSINTLDNYALINNQVIKSLNTQIRKNLSFHLLPEEPIPLDAHCKKFCMAKPTKYDVIIQGKKIGGASQRRTKAGLLHQGTISIAPLPLSYLQQILLPGTAVIEAMQRNSAYLLEENWTQKELQEMRKLLQAALQENISLI